MKQKLVGNVIISANKLHFPINFFLVPNFCSTWKPKQSFLFCFFVSQYKNQTHGHQFHLTGTRKNPGLFSYNETQLAFNSHFFFFTFFFFHWPEFFSNQKPFINLQNLCTFLFWLMNLIEID